MMLGDNMHQKVRASKSQAKKIQGLIEIRGTLHLLWWSSNYSMGGGGGRASDRKYIHNI